jgi:hypothetical protein
MAYPSNKPKFNLRSLREGTPLLLRGGYKAFRARHVEDMGDSVSLRFSPDAGGLKFIGVVVGSHFTGSWYNDGTKVSPEKYEGLRNIRDLDVVKVL